MNIIGGEIDVGRLQNISCVDRVVVRIRLSIQGLDCQQELDQLSSVYFKGSRKRVSEDHIDTDEDEDVVRGPLNPR